MKLTKNVKLNAVCYKVPNKNFVLISDSMNMTTDEYIRRSKNVALPLLNENWVFVKSVQLPKSIHIVYMYKCNSGSILTLNEKLIN
jgi:hypothetical protein